MMPDDKTNEPQRTEVPVPVPPAAPSETRDAPEDVSAPDDLPDDADQLREQIDATREELGDTVEALARKVDVKAQAKERIDDGKQRLHEAQEHAKETAQAAGAQARQQRGPLLGGAAALVIALVALWLIRRD